MNYNKEAINDIYIYDLIQSSHFKVIEGILYTNLTRNGKSMSYEWRTCGGLNTEGYKVLNTRMFGNQKSLYIHRIIYAFHNKYLNAYKTINHKNHNRSDNRIENLEEITWFENQSLPKRKTK